MRLLCEANVTCQIPLSNKHFYCKYFENYCFTVIYTETEDMDPLFLAYSFFRRRKFEESAALCSQLLDKNPYDQVNRNRLVLISSSLYSVIVIVIVKIIFSAISWLTQGHCNLKVPSSIHDGGKGFPCVLFRSFPRRKIFVIFIFSI